MADASYETRVKSAEIVKRKCKEYGLDEHQTKEVLKIIEQESKFDPNAINKKTGASGLGQFLENTWRGWLLKNGGRGDGYGKNPDGTFKDVFDAEANADATVKYYIDSYNKAKNDMKEGITLDERTYQYYHDGEKNVKEGNDSGGLNNYRNGVNKKDGIPDLSIPIKGIKKKVGTASVTPSPILLDLDGDGVETTALADGVYFDHNSNGFSEQTGWVSGDDGLLVRDINNDGIINDGKELFGDQTILSNGQKASNGFQALSELDENRDGKIDSNDAAYNQLKVWQDIDGDGYSSSDELISLSDAGVASINTGYTNTNITDPNGNTIKQTSSFTKSDGTTGAASDVYFQTDNMYTIANEWVDVPEDIAALPDLQGYGNVYDLQQAMVRDTSGTLKGLVEQFISATDTDTRHSLVIQILYKWTGVENVDPLSRAATKIYGNVIGDARKLATLEAFMGEGYVGTWCWGNKIKNHAMPPLSFLTGALAG